MYSPELQFSPTFRWGGREWGQNDRAAFEQFLKRRGGNFNRWQRRHPTAARAFDPVEQQLYGLFQPQLTAINVERQRRQEHYKRLMGDLTGFTSAIMPFLQGIAPAIGGAYSAGADTISGAGEGYGSMLNAQNAQTAGVANEVLGNIGAPEGQQVSGGDAGGVLAGVAGWVPEAMLRQQGGAYAEAASQLPRTAGHESNIMMKDLLRQALDEEGDFSSEVLKVLQGLPGARAEIRGQQESDFLARQKFSLDALKAERDYHMKEAYLALAQGDRKRYQQQLALSQQKEQRYTMQAQGTGLDGEPLPGFHRDPRTGEVVKDGWKIGPKGVPVKVASGSSASGGKDKPTPREEAKTVAQYQDDIDRYIARNMVKEKPITEGGGEELMPYKDAFQILWNRFKNTVSTAAGRRALKQAIIAALRAKGITPAPKQGNKGYGGREGGGR